MSSTLHGAVMDRATESGRRPIRAAWASRSTPSLMLVLGEAERQRRFSFALRKAIERRGYSIRRLAKLMGIDPRQITRWVDERGLPDLYQAQSLAHHLRVKESLFRNPPEVPPPPPEPYYPLEEYLLGAVDEGVEQGLSDEDPADEAGDEPDEPPAPRQRAGRR